MMRIEGDEVTLGDATFHYRLNARAHIEGNEKWHHLPSPVTYADEVTLGDVIYREFLRFTRVRFTGMLA